MAAFAAAVKIDAFAYLPVRTSATPFHLYRAEHGAGQARRASAQEYGAVLVSFAFAWRLPGGGGCWQRR